MTAYPQNHRRYGPRRGPPHGLLLALLGFALSCGAHGPAPPASWFSDQTAASGLSFVHETGARGEMHLPEIMGGGVALFDAEGDGDLDVFFTSGDFEREPGEAVGGPGRGRLFRHEAGLKFVDVTAASGLDEARYGMGAAVGDVDNDGDADLFLTNFGADQLYLNRGDGSFEDRTERAGIDVQGLSCSAVFCDYDLDGFLDLYVTRYVRYDPRQVCRNSSGQRDYCGPRAFNPASHVLLHNNGDGTFRDVSERAGLSRVAAAGLGVVCEDLNDDGRPDFYVANDQYANYLWLNRGDGTFEEQAVVLGAAYNLEGKAESGMGVIAADLDSDLDLDLFVTNLKGETNTLYRNLGRGSFEDATGGAGLAQSSLPYTGFGTVAFDVELDSDLDLLVANGRVFRGAPYPRPDVPEPWSFFAEPNLFYLNDGQGRFTAEPRLAEPFTAPIEISRGLATGDLDEDGDVDLVVTHVQGPAHLLRNDAPRAGHWLSVLAIDPALRREAIGARLTLEAGGRRFLRTVSRGFSYLSSNDPRAHFGLGAAESVSRLEVRWPDGLTERFEVPGVDRALTLKRGEGRAL